MDDTRLEDVEQTCDCMQAALQLGEQGPHILDHETFMFKKGESIKSWLDGKISIHVHIRGKFYRQGVEEPVADYCIVREHIPRCTEASYLERVGHDRRANHTADAVPDDIEDVVLIGIVQLRQDEESARPFRGEPRYDSRPYLRIHCIERLQLLNACPIFRAQQSSLAFLPYPALEGLKGAEYRESQSCLSDLNIQPAVGGCQRISEMVECSSGVMDTVTNDQTPVTRGRMQAANAKVIAQSVSITFRDNRIWMDARELGDFSCETVEVHLGPIQLGTTTPHRVGHSWGA